MRVPEIDYVDMTNSVSQKSKGHGNTYSIVRVDHPCELNQVVWTRKCIRPVFLVNICLGVYWHNRAANISFVRDGGLLSTAGKR